MAINLPTPDRLLNYYCFVSIAQPATKWTHQIKNRPCLTIHTITSQFRGGGFFILSLRSRITNQIRYNTTQKIYHNNHSYTHSFYILCKHKAIHNFMPDNIFKHRPFSISRSLSLSLPLSVTRPFHQPSTALHDAHDDPTRYYMGSIYRIALSAPHHHIIFHFRIPNS